jgi:ATP-dependent Clp protease ATP-binding subunit ClpA
VTEQEIASIVSRWTGIPVSRLQEGEREKRLRLDEILHKRIVARMKLSSSSRTPSSGPAMTSCCSSR